MSLHLDYNGDGRVSPAEDHQTYNRMRADDGAGAGGDGGDVGCWVAVAVVLVVIFLIVVLFILL